MSRGRGQERDDTGQERGRLERGRFSGDPYLHHHRSVGQGEELSVLRKYSAHRVRKTRPRSRSTERRGEGRIARRGGQTSDASPPERTTLGICDQMVSASLPTFFCDILSGGRRDESTQSVGECSDVSLSTPLSLFFGADTRLGPVRRGSSQRRRTAR